MTVKMGHYIKSCLGFVTTIQVSLNLIPIQSVPSCSVTLPSKLNHTQTSFSSCIRSKVTARSCCYCPPHHQHLGSANIADHAWQQLENTRMNSPLTLIKNSTGFLSAQAASSAESTLTADVPQPSAKAGCSGEANGGIPLSAPNCVWRSPE